MEKKRYSDEGWKGLIYPIVKQAFIDPAARRQIIRMHRNPNKTTQILCPWDSGENCFVTINRSSFKVAILAPNGQYRCLEYNKRGQLVRDTTSSDGPDQNQQ